MNWNDIYIYVPSVNEIVRIAEGTGDNLLSEDIEEGYIDYIYYDQYLVDVDMSQIDGGQIMKTRLLREIYNSIEECIPDVLDMAYGNPNTNYILLKREETEV